MSVDNAVRSAIEPIIAGANLFLESLTISSAGKNRIIRILVDGEKSLSLDEVTAITKPISERLDTVIELGERAFTLEVSSPGVDFPLTLERHWNKNKGRLVRGNTRSGEEFHGRIIDVIDHVVELDVKKGEIKKLAIDEIHSGHIEIEFK